MCNAQCKARALIKIKITESERVLEKSYDIENNVL